MTIISNHKRKIILLTGPKERPHFEQYLRSISPGLKVDFANSLPQLKGRIGRSFSSVRIITFLTDVIIPASILNRLKLTPYNIHPGPPEYPGSHPDSFAICDDAKSFGVTAHAITKRVDEGPIVALKRFDISQKIDRQNLANMTYINAIDVFKAVASHCARSDGDIAPMDISWSSQKYTKSDFGDLCRPAKNLPASTKKTLIRACGKDLVL